MTVQLHYLRDTAEKCFKQYFGRFTLFDLIPGARYSLHRPFTDSRGHTTPAQRGLTFRLIRPFSEVCFVTADGRNLEIYPEGIEDIEDFLRPEENPIPEASNDA